MNTDEKKERERIVKGMKKNAGSFKKRYGDRAKEVMYATATKLAQEETMNEENLNELSKKTIGKYIDANRRKSPSIYDSEYYGRENDKEAMSKLYDKQNKRRKYLELARAKRNKSGKSDNATAKVLAKEETLNELSKKTLMSYMQKSENEYYKTLDKKKKNKRLQGIVKAGLSHRKKLKEDFTHDEYHKAAESHPKYSHTKVSKLGTVIHHFKDGKTSFTSHIGGNIRVANVMHKGKTVTHRSLSSFKKHLNEDTLNELSDAKLADYKKKAEKSAEKLGNKAYKAHRKFRRKTGGNIFHDLYRAYRNEPAQGPGSEARKLRAKKEKRERYARAASSWNSEGSKEGRKERADKRDRRNIKKNIGVINKLAKESVQKIMESINSNNINKETQ